MAPCSKTGGMYAASLLLIGFCCGIFFSRLVVPLSGPSRSVSAPARSLPGLEALEWARWATFWSGADGNLECPHSGVCTLGSQRQIWNVPRLKYDSAKCKDPLECASADCTDGTCASERCSHGKCNSLVKDKAIFCERKTNITAGVLHQSFLSTVSRYHAIEQRLQMMDNCVETWRRHNQPQTEPCKRCHSVAANLDVTRVHANMLSRISRGKHSTVCETGFNRGDSALILATSLGKTTNVVSFSMNSRWYTSVGRKCLGGILKDTGQTVTYVDGATESSIINFLKRNPGLACDVIHVDGCKHNSCRLYDLHALSLRAHRGTLWATDDVELSCDRDTCQPLNNSKHCVFELFVKFMKSQEFTVKCVEASQGVGQCYGYASWDQIMHRRPS